MSIWEPWHLGGSVWDLLPSKNEVAALVGDRKHAADNSLGLPRALIYLLGRRKIDLAFSKWFPSCWFKVCGPFSVPLNMFSSLSSVCIFCGLQNRENLSLSYVFHLILQLGGLLLPPLEEVHKNFV